MTPDSREGCCTCTAPIFIFTRDISPDSIPVLEQALIACLEVGNFNHAFFSSAFATWYAIEKGEALDQIQKTSQKYIAFARENHNDLMLLVMWELEQFATRLKGLTAEPATFDDVRFRETDLLATFAKAKFGPGLAFFHIARQIAAFTYVRYPEALASATAAVENLHGVMSTPLEITHRFYHALTLTSLYPHMAASQKQETMALLGTLVQRLKFWADTCPENFSNRYLLVLAELASIEGQDMQAMRHHDAAIRSARDNGFVQNEALANELAGRFYREYEFETIAWTYLRNARYCYLQWGALGKVKQLDQRYPGIETPVASGLSAPFGGRAEDLDLMMLLKASQAVSGEMMLDNLIETLLKIVIEHAGAERGLLILAHDKGYRIAAEATTGDNQITVLLRQGSLTLDEIPMSIFHYVLRTQELVLLEDASGPNQFWEDEYVRRTRLKSVLSLPLVKQARVVGVLYLENKLIPGTFNPNRVALLDLLASQAAIALENAALYTDLQQENHDRQLAEEALRQHRDQLEESIKERTSELVRQKEQLNQTLTELELILDNASLGIVHTVRVPEGTMIKRMNGAMERMLGYEPGELTGMDTRAVHRTDQEYQAARRINNELLPSGQSYRGVQVFLRKDGFPIFVELVGSAIDTGDPPKGNIWLSEDITQRRHAQAEIQTLNDNLQHHSLQLNMTVAEAMGGRTWVESVPGRCSTFTFTALFAHLNQDARCTAVPSACLRGLRVLVVDDNATLRGILAGLLESWSMQVATAASGAQALALFADAAYVCDLVLLDRKMPGLETARRLRRDLQLPHPPVMFMLTAYDCEDIAIEAQCLGIQTFLIKPVEASMLLDAIEAVFGTRAAAPSERAATLFTAALPDIRGARILVAEDNEINQQVMQEILQEAGAVSDIIANGREAVRLALEPARHYDLVLMDVQMPDMDGLEATSEIRKHFDKERLPIIAVTAHAMEQERQRCQGAGMNHHIPKPVDPNRLLHAMAHWIGPATGLPGRAARRQPTGHQDALPEALPGFSELAVALERVNGNAKLLRKLILAFHDKFSGFGPAFQRFMEAGNQRTATELVHSLKGGAGTLGAMAVAQACAALEHAMRRDQAGEIPQRLALVEQTLEPMLASAAGLRTETSEQRGAIQVPPAHPWPPVVDAGMAKLMTEIGTLLAKNNLRARKRFADLRRLLEGRGIDGPVDQLDNAFERLDYQSARAILDAIAAELGMAKIRY